VIGSATKETHILAGLSASPTPTRLHPNYRDCTQVNLTAERP
jgi:hypothetical protein